MAPSFLWTPARSWVGGDGSPTDIGWKATLSAEARLRFSPRKPIQPLFRVHLLAVFPGGSLVQSLKVLIDSGLALGNSSSAKQKLSSLRTEDARERRRVEPGVSDPMVPCRDNSLHSIIPSESASRFDKTPQEPPRQIGATKVFPPWWALTVAKATFLVAERVQPNTRGRQAPGLVGAGESIGYEESLKSLMRYAGDQTRVLGRRTFGV